MKTNALIKTPDGRLDFPAGSADERPEFLSRGEVARMFGVSASTVTRWARTGMLPTARTPGGHYRFRAEDLRRIARSLAGVTPEVSAEGPSR